MVLTSSGREREGAGLEGESGSVLGTGHLEGLWLLLAETGGRQPGVCENSESSKWKC